MSHETTSPGKASLLNRIDCVDVSKKNSFPTGGSIELRRHWNICMNGNVRSCDSNVSFVRNFSGLARAHTLIPVCSCRIRESTLRGDGAVE